MLNIYRESAVDATNPMNKLRDVLTRNQSTYLSTENSVVGCESAGDTEFEALSSSHNTLASQLSTQLEGLGNESADAMAQALMVCADQDKLKSAMAAHLGEQVGNESFDSDSVVNNLHLTVGVAGELAVGTSDSAFIFPRIVVDQKTTNYKLKATRTVIEPKFYHGAAGKVTDWGKLNLLDAAVKDNMLRKELNVFVPEFTSGNKTLFVDEGYVTPWTVKRSDGKVVTTSFLGTAEEEFNLITLSTTSGMDRNTEATILDRIDEGAKVRGIIVGIGEAADTTAVYLSTASANHSTFTKSETAGEANQRNVAFGKTTMMLNLKDYVKPETGGFPDIADIAPLKALLDAGYSKIGFKVSNTYSLDLSNGTYGGTVANPQIAYIEKDDAIGVNALAHAEANDSALLKAVKALYLGSDIGATLSNGTLKIDGDKLGSQDLDKLYPLQVRTPVEIRSEVLSKHGDAETIKMLSQALAFRRDDETVAELHDWFNWAVANLGHEGVSDFARTDLDIIGLHYLLKPYVKNVDIDLEKLLKEEDTTGKLSVLEVGLVTKMQDELVQAIQETNYRSVVRTHGSDASHVPEWNIFGDSRLTNYIMRTGEDRTFGDGVTMAEKPTIHPTDRENMREILYAMPRAKDMNNPRDRIFGFGHSIELTPVVVKRARDNGIAHDQVQIWPVYTNVITTPILLKFNVKGLAKYFSEASKDKVVNG